MIFMKHFQTQKAEKVQQSTREVKKRAVGKYKQQLSV